MAMKQLKFYIENIDSNLLNTVGGRAGQLIQLIRSGSYLNEEALAAQLFSGKWEHQNYLNVKNKAKKILEAYFMMSPPKKNNEILKKLQRCRKFYFLGMSFIESFKREEAKKMMEEAYKIAVEYGFTRLAYDSAIELMIDASLNKKAAKFRHYSEEIRRLETDLQAERVAFQLLLQVGDLPKFLSKNQSRYAYAIHRAFIQFPLPIGQVHQLLLHLVCHPRNGSRGLSSGETVFRGRL